MEFWTKKRLMFLSGCFLGLSMPGSDFFLLAFFGFIPVLLSIFLSKSYKNSFINAYIFCIGFNMFSLNWILSIHPFQGIALALFIWFLISALCAISFGLWGLAVKFIMNLKIINVLKIFCISASWILLNNYLGSSLEDLSFPWAMIEYSQHNNPYFLQLASIFSGAGLGFYLIMFNSAFAIIIFKTFTNKFSYLKSASYLLLTFLCIGLFHGAGFWLYNNHKISEIPQITLVQTDVSMEDSHLKYFSTDNLKKYYLKKINKSPDGIIIFPEEAIPGCINQDDPQWVSKLQQTTLNQDKTIVIGYVNRDKKNVTNSAMIIDNNAKNHYDKIYLVPFGEEVPYDRFLPSFMTKQQPFLKYKKGTKLCVIKTKYGNIAPSICYEIIFPQLMRQQKLNNAELFVNISNLGWFKSCKLREQYIAIAKMRAVENRIPIAASINTGFSFVIDSRGNVLKLFK
ncbi:MAG: apolipoprotein N-acyltransferase [Candidatus Gastranaerophilaceae bacterium]|jgi:apolipoprotein N-acyltransferase